ncbi:MAG TPA: hypothetical protein VL993_14825 [Stellaceae bacterium]|nr:hypothetical protein [Stellaceae bacterium]
MAASGGQIYRAAHDENISGTLRPIKRCGFITSGDERPARFCDAPAAAGGAYCVRHRALCQVAPGSAEGQRLLREMEREAAAPAPPTVGPMLTREMLEPTAPDEAALGLGMPRGAPAEDAS